MQGAALHQKLKEGHPKQKDAAQLPDVRKKKSGGIPRFPTKVIKKYFEKLSWINYSTFII